MDRLHTLGTDQHSRHTGALRIRPKLVHNVSIVKIENERNDMLGVGWRAERPSISIVVVVDGSEPLRSDISLPPYPVRKNLSKTGTLGVQVRGD